MLDSGHNKIASRCGSIRRANHYVKLLGNVKRPDLIVPHTNSSKAGMQ